MCQKRANSKCKGPVTVIGKNKLVMLKQQESNIARMKGVRRMRSEK